MVHSLFSEAEAVLVQATFEAKMIGLVGSTTSSTDML
jgi:hypothetical protein